MTRFHDQHLHSRFSGDSKADPRANCLHAIDQGLSGLTFTEHYDRHPTERDSCIWDYAVNADSVSALREEFSDRLTVNLGIEVCYQPDAMPEILDHLQSNHFDLVLLSIHWCGGRPLHVKKEWSGIDHRAATRTYFETALEAMQFCLKLKNTGQRAFDVLGHMDLVKRYARRYWDAFDIHECEDLVDEIWRTVIAADILPEINTSTLRDRVGEPMPGEWTIGRYVESGGKVMSIGSDSHRSDHIGAGFDTAKATLLRAGIEAAAVFTNREMEVIPLA